MAVYAVSDLHGQYNTFMAGLEKINFSDQDTLYFIGDAIDRGPDGIKILKYIKDHDNMDLIIGNHEFMMLNAVEPNGKKRCNGKDTMLWLYFNAGRITFEKYGNLSVKERQSLLTWLNRRYVIKTVEVGERKFCLTHSYYDKRFENKMYYELEYDDVWKMVWTSLFRQEDETHGTNIYKDYPEYTFITGHVPVIKAMRRYMGHDQFNELRILEHGNLIDIDGGCAIGYHPGVNNGALFLRLDDMKTFPIAFVENRISDEE